MRFKSCLIVLFVLITLFSYTSCDEVLEVTTYSTPTIKGKVSLPDGAAVDKGSFYIQVVDSDTEKAVYTNSINTDGTFVVSGLDASKKYSVLLTTEKPDSQTQTSKAVKATTSGYGGWIQDVVASVDTGHDIGAVSVKPLGTITGKVILADRAEDENYGIDVFIPGTSYMAKTDDDGSFSIYNVPQSTYRLRYMREGYVSVLKENVILSSSNDTESPVKKVDDVSLVCNTGSLEGIATLDGKSDHTGITILAVSSDGTRTYDTSTLGNGYFRLNDMVPGSYTVTASYSGYPSVKSSGVEVKAGDSSILSGNIVLLEKIGTINGKASLKGSDVKEGINILISGPSSNYTALTDQDGKFTKTVAPGSYTVTASYPGYTSVQTSAVVEMGASTDIVIPSLVSSVGGISGKVILEDAIDASGAVVTLLGRNGENKGTTITSADGSYAIRGIETAGQYYLTVSKDGYITNSNSMVSISLGVVSSVPDITLKNLTSKVKGSVSLEGTADYSGTLVLLKTKDGNTQYNASTESNGEYVINKVNPGTYTLTISKSGYVSKTVSDIVVSSATEKTIEKVSLLVGTRSVTGKVDLELVDNEAGALITATCLETPSLVYTAISNSQGSFTLAGMKPGQYTVTVSAANYNTKTLETISILEGSTLDIGTTELPIARGSITGVAVLEGRSSSADIKVELLKGSDVYATVLADDSGSYVFSVPQGNYSGVRLSAENFRSAFIAQSIALIANDYVTIEGGGLTMVATHVPEVKGRVTVTGLLSQDYSGTTVSLDELPEFTVETDTDGNWSFSKVPVGNYTLRMVRENTVTVTKSISVVAAASKTIETIALEPNAASIEGHVTLSGVSDYSGITVRATADGTVELRTTTNAAGYFYIGNVITTKGYTVHFEKAGWNSVERTVSGLANLSLNDITSSNPVSLTDTTKPVINGMTVVPGNSDPEGRKLAVYLNVTEEGSGAARVYVNTTNDFTGIIPITYADPVYCHVADTAGSYTLYAKVEDVAGNVSTVSSAPFTVADYRTVVSGVLVDNEDGASDGVITWTKARSPYYVTNNILVEEGNTLVVEPGVVVQFSGAYYIQADGTIKINGTESENVYFYGVGSGEGQWKGINCTKDKGSEIRYARMNNMKEGVQGYVRIKDSVLESNGYVLGIANKYFYGSLEDSSCTGRIYVDSVELYCSTFSLGSSESIIKYSHMSGSTFEGTGTLYLANCVSENSKYTGLKLYHEYSGAKNTTFSNCRIGISGGGLFYLDTFDSCTFNNDFIPARIISSNIISCGTITVNTARTEYEKVDLTGNYWGAANTAELNANGVNSNKSFIDDYYDDFNRTKADVSEYVTEMIAEAGYKGEAYYNYGPESATVYSIGDIGPAGGWVCYDKGYYSDGWRYLEVAPSIIGEKVFGSYRATDDSGSLPTGTAASIGSGRINTEMLVLTMGKKAYTSKMNGETTADYAAKACLEYSVNGYDDWFFPSKDELNQMYVNLYKNGIVSFNSRYNMYLSSSEGFNNDAWYQVFLNGEQSRGASRYSRDTVCAIRAF